MLILNMNGVMCYFPKCVVLQNNRCVKGSNIDISKLESRVKVQHFLSQVFENFILQFGLICCWKMWCRFFLCWCHKHLLIKYFIFGDVNNALGPWINSLQRHYYLKDLNCVYFACQALPHGIKHQMLFIDNKPSKALQNL